MKKIEIKELYNTDYSVKLMNTLTQRWDRSNVFNCIGNPRHSDMLLYLSGYNINYTLKNGEKIFAKNGSIVYAPKNSEYVSKFCAVPSSKNNCTILVNFSLFDTDNNPFVLSDNITVFSADNENYKEIFKKLDNYGTANIVCYAKIKSVMYDLLFKLSKFYHKNVINKFSIIEKGITYLEQDERLDLSVSEIADMCNVSEVYFRKLFKEYSGVSPSEYRTSTKICKAKNYLLEDTLSIAEISDRTGFSDVAYFIKIFKQITGVTPNAYRKTQNRQF